MCLRSEETGFRGVKIEHHLSEVAILFGFVSRGTEFVNQ
jgi:hypothetical protein